MIHSGVSRYNEELTPDWQAREELRAELAEHLTIQNGPADINLKRGTAATVAKANGMGRSPRRAAPPSPQRMGTVTAAAKIPLVGLASAAAARLVGVGRAGLAVDAAAGLAGMLTAVNNLLARPFPVYYTPQTPRFLLLGTALYAGTGLVLAA